MLNKIMKDIQKYWLLISIGFTILSTIGTIAWNMYGKFDKLNDTVNATNQWVSDHDDDIQQLKADNIRLKEDERLREAGLLK